MRLLNTRTLKLEHYPDVRSRPRYAILSHMWGEATDEVLYSDIASGVERCRHKKGFAKIKYTCDEARENGIDYAWIDTCCIDKTSSAELSEAINSMFEWYRKAVVCYAYLADVSYWPIDIADLERLFGSEPYVEQDNSKPIESRIETTNIESSRWFLRGWTLQELIAPKHVRFYDSAWTFIGSKSSLASTLTKTTAIPENVLLHRRHLADCSIANRMSWAARRQTTRIEDEAYCLMGIFGVHMPLMYGEVRSAFARLQKEIIGQSCDHSIFAWYDQTDGFYEDYFSSGPKYLATSPACFADTGSFAPIPRSIAGKTYNISHRGLEVTADLVYNVLEERDQTTISKVWDALGGLFDIQDSTVYAILDCFDTDHCTRRLALELDPSNSPDPKMATEYTIRQSLSVEAAPTEQIKVTRSITILNDDFTFNIGYKPTVDLRVRCFFMYDWSSMSSVAGTSTESEELSLHITRWWPTGSWDPQHSILSVHESEWHCAFMGKLCYTPRNRRALGATPSEVVVIVRLDLGIRREVKARIYLETEATSIESTWMIINEHPIPLPKATETMNPYPLSATKLSRWNVRILHINPSANDPYGTLAIAVLPPRSWKRMVENLLVSGNLAKILVKRVSPLTWTRNVRLRDVHYEFWRSSRNHQERSYKPPIANAPCLTVRDVYGGRKRWRQARFDEIMNVP